MADRFRISRTRWFGPRRIGFGIGPRAWQGWAATAVLIVATFAVGYAVDLDEMTRRLLHAAILIAFFATVVLTYGADTDG